MCFITQFLKKTKEVDPDLTSCEAVKKGSKIWNEMTDDQKKMYFDEAKLDEVRHEKEMKEFNETGYFTNKDGVNSKDVAPQMKKITTTTKNGKLQFPKSVPTGPPVM